MVQALHISNGDTINEKLKAADGRVQQLLDAEWPAYRIIEEVYLSTLSRYPSDGEMNALLSIVGSAGDDERRIVVEDLYWSVLSSREFLFHR
jgi:hypothetical protein